MVLQNEGMAILAACLVNRDVERAGAIMEKMRQRGVLPSDIRIFNLHLEALIEPKDVNDQDEHCIDTGVDYYKFLEELDERSSHSIESIAYFFEKVKREGVRPNVTTFVYLLKVCMKEKQHSLMYQYIGELLDEGHSIDDLIDSPHWKTQEKQNLKLLIDKIFQDATNDTKDSQVESAGQDGTSNKLGNGDCVPKKPIEIDRIRREICAQIENARVSSEAREIGFSVDTGGMHELKSALKLIDPSVKSMHRLQLDLETFAIDRVAQRLKEVAPGKSAVFHPNNALRTHIFRWAEALTEAIRLELKMIKKYPMDLDRCAYGPFLALLAPEKLAMITIHEMLSLYNANGVRNAIGSSRALVAIGRGVQYEYNAQQVQKYHSFLGSHHSAHAYLKSSGKLFHSALRRLSARLEEDDLLRHEKWNPKWPIDTKAKLGAVLAQLLLKTAMIPVRCLGAQGSHVEEIVPAFYHTYQFVDGRKLGVFRVHDTLDKLITQSFSKGEFIHPHSLPMVVTPRLWTKYNNGGYLLTDALCMRVRHCAEQIHHLRAASNAGQLDAVLGGLDVLGSTPWRINEEILNIVLKVWDSDEIIAGIPPRKDEPIPSRRGISETDPESKRKLKKLRRKIDLMNRNNHSLRCDINYKLEIANRFRGFEIYFPHTLDFRGRAYPMPPLLNHIGSDLCRGLLQFYEAKRLGARGLRWLKIHLANVYGMDKLTFDERVLFADNNRESIFDSADRPLDGNRWWLKAEDPWQCLATCMDLTAALRSPVPEDYMSRLHIHLDGSCNGLQHYAALGGDVDGGREVNLLPSEKPQDIYSGVASIVNSLIDKDIDTLEIAKKLVGKIDRKIVKTTVMTNVYGVTFAGARLQVEDKLIDRSDIDPEIKGKASVYITKKVFQSLRQMFSVAKEIQDWITTTAKEISRSLPEKPSKDSVPDAAVVWTTPLGLPIVQPYRKNIRRQIPTLMQMVFIEENNSTRPVDAMRQRSGFAPNFIHSLDASHMLMTANACYEAGITFASVHDSYWTHAATTDEMNRLIREKFVELHQKNIMENLRNELLQRYGNRVVPCESKSGVKSYRPICIRPLPKRGNLDLNLVKDSLYFFD